MLYRLLADAIVLVHLSFVVFVVVGGFLAWKWRRLVWLHLPAAIWGVGIEWAGKVCPLTPLENWLRLRGGDTPYPGDFIEHYLLPILYPSDLTRTGQVLIGAFALALNLFAYWHLWRSRRARSTV